MSRSSLAMDEAEAREYLADLERGGAARIFGITTAVMDFDNRNGYRARVTDMAVIFAKRESGTWAVPDGWYPVRHERNATWYVCDRLLAAQKALGVTVKHG